MLEKSTTSLQLFSLSLASKQYLQLAAKIVKRSPSSIEASVDWPLIQHKSQKIKQKAKIAKQVR